MKKTVVLGAVLFSLLLWSCMVEYTPTEPIPTPTPTPTPVATSITLSATSLSFASLGDTTQFAATVKDAAGTVMAGATVTWAATDGQLQLKSTYKDGVVDGWTEEYYENGQLRMKRT